MANDWPSRSSTSVSARRVVSAGMRKPCERDAVVEVERADLGLHLQPDDVAGDRRPEVQPDAELLEHDRHRCRSRPARSGPGTRRRRGSSPPGRCRRSGSARPGSGSSRFDSSALSTPPMPCLRSKKNRFRKSLNTSPSASPSCRRSRARRTAASSSAPAKSLRVGEQAEARLASARGGSPRRSAPAASPAGSSLPPGQLQHVDRPSPSALARRRSRPPAASPRCSTPARTRMTASSLTATRMSSPGKSCWSCLLQRRDAGIDDDVVLLAPAGAPDDQADGAGALPSISTSRGCTTTASAIVGIGDGDAGDVEVRRQHHRPPAVSIRTRSRSSGGRGAASADAGAWRRRRLRRRRLGARRRARRPGSSDSTAGTRTALLRILLARRHVVRPLLCFVLHRLRASAWRRESPRPCRESVAAGAARRARGTATAGFGGRRGNGAAGTAAAPAACPSARRRGCPALSVGALSSGLRSVSVIRPSAAASAMRSASSGVTSSVTTDVGIGRPSWRAFSWSKRVPAVSTWTFETTTRATLSRCWAWPLERDDDVDARARHDEAGDADHLVDPHRDRAHAGRNGRRQAGAGADGGELGLGDRLVGRDGRRWRRDRARAPGRRSCPARGCRPATGRP